MAIQAFRVGAGGTDTPSDVKTGFVLVASASNYMTFESPIGTDVVVTAGKTLYITKLRAIQSIGDNWGIGYGDDGVAAGAAAPTNFVSLVTNLEANVVDHEFEMIIKIPTGKYPCILTQAGAADVKVYMEGIEVTN